MNRSLYWKLTLAFILVAVTSAALVAIFIRLTSANQLQQFLLEQQRADLQQSLSTYYTQHGSWDDVADNWNQIQVPLLGQNPPPPEGPHSEESSHGNVLGLANAQGMVIVPVDPAYPAGSRLPAQIYNAGAPITVNGKQVGVVLTSTRPQPFNPEENLYLQRTNQALLLAVIGAFVVALIGGALLARTLTQPLRLLTQAAQHITEGQVEQEVPVKSNDELGQLARAFNRMSQEIARVNQSRRQMIADIAHDLRTPLTVIGGYIESMAEGVLQPTPQRLDLIYAEIERFQALVEDFRMLSLVDAGELAVETQPVSPNKLFERAADLFRIEAEQNQIEVVIDSQVQLPNVQADEARMAQVFTNLMSNALRYTPAGGKIMLSACAKDGSVDMTVKDTGAGILPDELPHIFERFYRVDKSRNNESGESGLGLAIVKALIELQNGTVWAESIPGEGTTIHLLLPISRT